MNLKVTQSAKLQAGEVSVTCWWQVAASRWFHRACRNSPVKIIDRLTAAAQTAVTSVVGEVEGVLVRHAVDHVGELEGAALVSDEIRCNETEPALNLKPCN